jgi:hypothetical protein
MSTGFLLFQPSFLVFQVIVTEQFGLIPDGKGVKVRGFNCDKKQGLQVSEKQLISPWDLLEGHKNPAPLSFHWFQAGLEKNQPRGFFGVFWGFFWGFFGGFSVSIL